MSDPFEISPPQWLVNVAKPVNGTEMGKAFAMGLSSLVGAFEKDPNAAPDASWLGSRKGLETSMAEVSNAQIDPQWRVKGQLMANQVLEQRAQLAAQGALAEERRKETSAWMEDAPKLAPWITATPEERKGMASPDAKSKIGMQTLQKQSLADQRYYTSQGQMANRLDQERLKAEHSAGITAKVADWNDALGSADPATFSAISALQDQKGVVNGGRLPNGLPTPEAISLLNQFRTSNGMTLYGTKASEYLEKPAKAGSLSQRDSIKAKNLQASITHYQTQLDKTDDPAKQSEFQNKMDAAQSELDGLLGGKPSIAKAGTDTQAKKVQHDLNVAIAGGDKKEIKVATQAAQKVKKTWVLDNQGQIAPEDDDKRNDFISKLKVGSLFYDPSKGKAVEATREIIDQAANEVEEVAKKKKVREESNAAFQADIKRATIPEWQRYHGTP